MEFFHNKRTSCFFLIIKSKPNRFYLPTAGLVELVVVTVAVVIVETVFVLVIVEAAAFVLVNVELVVVGVDGGLTTVALSTFPVVSVSILTRILSVCDEPAGGG